MIEYEYEVWQGDDLLAGGRENDYASAQSEASHYAAMYALDGPVEVRIYEKRLLSAAKVQPERRPYNASGSLSEYGVFPECDAQQPVAEPVKADPVPAQIVRTERMAVECTHGHLARSCEICERDARIAELETRVHDLSSALRELLQDTQHVDHNCGDGPDLCPVLNAREVLVRTIYNNGVKYDLL